MNITDFEQSDWNHLHDVVYNVTGKSVKNEELEIIFNTLPSHLKHLAYEWGMNDTVFRDDTHTHLTEVRDNEIKAKDEMNTLFTVWVVKMLNEGRMWFSTRPGVVGEPDIDELDVVVEFSGGGERIGNDGSGAFSWRELQKMADKQGELK